MLTRKQARVVRELFDRIDGLSAAGECTGCGQVAKYCQDCGEPLSLPSVDATDVQRELEVPRLDSDVEALPESSWTIANDMFKRKPGMLSPAVLLEIARTEPERLLDVLEHVSRE